MSKTTVELRTIKKLPNGNEIVNTGYYVFSNMTIDEIKRMFKDADADRVEFDLHQEDSQ